MLRLDASTSLQDGRYLSFYNSITPAGVIDDVASLTMRRAPRATWSLGAHYARPAGRGTITFSARFRHVSSYAACIAPDPAALQAHVIMTDRRCVVEPHATLDAALVLAVPVNGIAAKLSLYGRNILDNRGLEAVLPIAGLFTPSEARPPRQIGTRLDLAF